MTAAVTVPGRQLPGRSADRAILTALCVLRAGTLLVGFGHGGPTVWLAAGLAGQSSCTLLRSWHRLAGGQREVLDGRSALVETGAGLAALVVATRLARPDPLGSAAPWLEPYTVITAVLLAACTWRAWARVAAATSLAATYLACVLFASPAGSTGGAPLNATIPATAWNNALSYPLFFLIAAAGFSLIRLTVDRSAALGRWLGRLAAEQARVSAAAAAYRIGHDIPKALLREIRRGEIPVDQLRPWASKYRDDLQRALGPVASGPVDLGTELRSLCAAFAPVTRLSVDLTGLAELPPGAPGLLVTEAVRELLNNASYHAAGHPVQLRAISTTHTVQVSVHSGGTGVDADLLRSTWARKQNPLHQVEAAGGAYRITTDPGHGMTVTLTWPAGEGTELPLPDEASGA